MAHGSVSDPTHNYLTARVANEPDAFLIKPGDFMFGEVTASSLIEYDFDGAPRQEGCPKLRGGGILCCRFFFNSRELPE